MDTLALLQHYWWFLISLLGALLVFLLFVQGGQAVLYDIGKTPEERNTLTGTLGSKWEITFTTLVTFGGAFFASFPLFYSTSFGGAYYVWMAILLVFVLQAVGYEFRRKPGNVYGGRTFDVFLQINGILGPLLLGVAVGTLFTGASFTVDRLNLADTAGGGAAVISQWTTPWHGLEALASTQNIFLGVSVALLAILLGCQYFLLTLDDPTLRERSRERMIPAAVAFLLFFLAWFIRLLLSDGWAVDGAGRIAVEPYKYLHNLLEMPAVAAVLLVGLVSVLWSIALGWWGRRHAVWFGGAGTVLTVLALLLCAGWNHTAYYPSTADIQSSLTIANSSSSRFTLQVMSVVSLFIPLVVAYIWYAWRSLSGERNAAARENK
ncbi:cytochrome d ubiquinol oxidase subunit II [Alistipes sp.]|uniref:cytochrome d ubiquinol oxidase subunit II n=1 Tax=Alistipes sp. TaxID=1872444 RepID=UPI003AEFCF59